MPKLKKSPVEQRDNLIIAKINYYAELQGVAIDRLANAARISVKTMYTRRKNPGQFSVEELDRICNYLHIPITELFQR
ncbi:MULTISPECIES: helix-turn-helix domain-containing protein [Clostridiaceae]|uniref:Helix-turn-helix domain-containing protein n=1 Tax=Clostridium facile TaxID=2763035 RepID=A0ABR7INR6_9CLOT|nr:helix-turn-helix domain-containing protein [Massilioclostridium coli]MBC5786775.1 helix-turn-helix domain-containing protein [Clostridium facile]